MPGRLPRTLLHGRVRTSTVLLSLLFVATFALYLQVRPPPAGSPVGAGGAARPARAPSVLGHRHHPVPVDRDLDARDNLTVAVGPSTTRAETTRPAPTSTTPGATGTSAPSQSGGAMTPELSGTDPTRQTLLILGATGDLTARLLLPGLGALVASGEGSSCCWSAAAGTAGTTTAGASGSPTPSRPPTPGGPAGRRRPGRPVPQGRRHRRGRPATAPGRLPRTRGRLLRPAAGGHGPGMPGAGRRRAARAHPAGAGEAVRHGRGQRRRPQRPPGPAGPRRPGVPGRPLPGHVHRAEHPGAAVRQPHARVGAERRARPERRHRLRRVPGPGRPSRLLRSSRRAGRHDPEPLAPGTCPACHGGPEHVAGQGRPRRHNGGAAGHPCLG